MPVYSGRTEINDISLVSRVSRPYNRIGFLMNGKTEFARFTPPPGSRLCFNEVSGI